MRDLETETGKLETTYGILGMEKVKLAGQNKKLRMKEGYSQSQKHRSRKL